MNNRTRTIILLVVAGLFLYAIGSYLFLTNKRLRSDLGILVSRVKHELVRPTPFPTPATTPTPLQRVEITNSPFSKIRKSDVEVLAAGGGIKEIALVYDPPPKDVREQLLVEASKAGQTLPQFPVGPVKTPALAGYFKGINGTVFTLTQKDGKEYAIDLTDATRLWINTAGKLEIVSQFVTKFPDPVALFSPDELVLATHLSDQTTPMTTPSIIVYR